MNGKMSTRNMSRRGMMIILSSPSGAGKTTISKRLLHDDNDLKLSISHTTRPPRAIEQEGKDYYFVTTSDFLNMVNDKMFLEHAKVFDNYYGTSKQQVLDVLSKGSDVLFDIDWQGARQILSDNLQDVVSIFILPPSYKELQSRLDKRAQDSKDIITKRMHGALSEISHWNEYNYVVINDDLDLATQKVHNIIRAERLKRFRQPALEKLVSSFDNSKQD